jgi:hypothetical protein
MFCCLLVNGDESNLSFIVQWICGGVEHVGVPIPESQTTDPGFLQWSPIGWAGLKLKIRKKYLSIFNTNIQITIEDKSSVWKYVLVTIEECK